jgi:hypothetical protein
MAHEIGGRFLDDQPVKGSILPGRLRRMLCPKTGCFMGTCSSRWPIQDAFHHLPMGLPDDNPSSFGHHCGIGRHAGLERD